MHELPALKTDNPTVDKAFRIALGDITTNIVPYQDGLLEEQQAVFIAGLDYVTPWTRDAAINTWNGGGLLWPEVARNTLLSVLQRENGLIMFGGEYWDAVIWLTGVWQYYLFTGDHTILPLAFEAGENSLAFFERTEFSHEPGLFRGPACYGDGVAAYPDRYAATGGESGIIHWPRHNPELKTGTGRGIPMQVLSTNLLYFNAYLVMSRISAILQVPGQQQYLRKAEQLKAAIVQRLWSREEQRYHYFIDPSGACSHQEGLGNSLAILFGIADTETAEAVFRAQHVTPVGIPCVWPPYERYLSEDGMSFGRHSGTVWPHIQGFWAHAAAVHGKIQLFSHELLSLAEHAVRDSQFTEIYHPVNGLPYGGIQERDGEPRFLWASCSRQTWSASAYLRMILFGLLGMKFSREGISLSPLLPAELRSAELRRLRYRNLSLDIAVEGSGREAAEVYLNGKKTAEAFIDAEQEGHISLRIVLR